MALAVFLGCWSPSSSSNDSISCVNIHCEAGCQPGACVQGSVLGDVGPKTSWAGSITAALGPWARPMPGEFYGQRSLASHSPLGCKESDMTEQLTHMLGWAFFFFTLHSCCKVSLTVPPWQRNCQESRRAHVWVPGTNLVLKNSRLALHGVCSKQWASGGLWVPPASTKDVMRWLPGLSGPGTGAASHSTEALFPGTCVWPCLFEPPVSPGQSSPPHTRPHGSHASQDAVGGTTCDPPRNTGLHEPGARHMSHLPVLWPNTLLQFGVALDLDIQRHTRQTWARRVSFLQHEDKARLLPGEKPCLRQMGPTRSFLGDGGALAGGRVFGLGKGVWVQRLGSTPLPILPLCLLPALHQLMQPMGRKMLWSQNHLRSRNPASVCPGHRRREEQVQPAPHPVPSPLRAQDMHAPRPQELRPRGWDHCVRHSTSENSKMLSLTRWSGYGGASLTSPSDTISPCFATRLFPIYSAAHTPASPHLAHVYLTTCCLWQCASEAHDLGGFIAHLEETQNDRIRVSPPS